jgi:hypothetical protein
MKKNNIINKEIEVKVDKMWDSLRDLLNEDINKEIDRCDEIYMKCGGEFKTDDEEDYVLKMINLRENILDFVSEG